MRVTKVGALVDRETNKSAEQSDKVEADPSPDWHLVNSEPAPAVRKALHQNAVGYQKSQLLSQVFPRPIPSPDQVEDDDHHAFRENRLHHQPMHGVHDVNDRGRPGHATHVGDDRHRVPDRI